MRLIRERVVAHETCQVSTKPVWRYTPSCQRASRHRPNSMVYSYCTGTGPGLTQQATKGPGPCLPPVWTFWGSLLSIWSLFRSRAVWINIPLNIDGDVDGDGHFDFTCKHGFTTAKLEKSSSTTRVHNYLVITDRYVGTHTDCGQRV